MSKMLIGQKHRLLRALPDSSLWPSVSFSSRCPRAIRHHQQLTCRGGCDGKSFSPQQCLTNCRRLQGKTAVLQIHRNNSTIIILMWRSIMFWVYYVLSHLTFVTPQQWELDSRVWKNLYLSSSSKEQTDGPWAAKMFCSQIKLFYTVHIIPDSLAQSTPCQ